MDRLKIIFANGDFLVLSAGDTIHPIVEIEHNSQKSVSMAPPSSLEIHIHNGLIPSLLESLYTCNFFYINDNQNIAYGTHSIVRLELC